MEGDNPDGLEDWVAVREQPFFDNEPKTRLDIHVAWNDVEDQVAITCREHSRVAGDTEPKGWSAALSVTELQSIHEQLSLIHPSLGPYLPALPIQPRGLWAYISSVEPLSHDVCEEIYQYLKVAVDICGQKLFLSTLFEEHSYDEYFENISELRRRMYDEDVFHAEDQLQNVIFLRKGSINMLDMAVNYQLEDDAIFKYNVALAQLYNYLLQPFLDMRELAITKLKEARSGLQNENFGQRRKAEYAIMFSEWRLNYVHSLDTVQELYMEYYGKTFQLLAEVMERMDHDKKMFGKNAFEVVASERFFRIQEDMLLEELQYLQAKKRHQEQERDKVNEEVNLALSFFMLIVFLNFE